MGRIEIVPNQKHRAVKPFFPNGLLLANYMPTLSDAAEWTLFSKGMVGIRLINAEDTGISGVYLA